MSSAKHIIFFKLQIPSHLKSKIENIKKMQLIRQLQSQISQLYPLKQSIVNLSSYYHQLRNEYQELLRERSCSYHGSQIYKINAQAYHQQLRSAQVQYQELGDYLNLHLIDKFKECRKENNDLCKQFTQQQEQLKQVKDKLRQNAIQSNILANTFNQLNQSIDAQSFALKKLAQTNTIIQIQANQISESTQQIQQKITYLKSLYESKVQQQSSLLQSYISLNRQSQPLSTQIKQQQKEQQECTKKSQKYRHEVELLQSKLRNLTSSICQIQQKIAETNTQNQLMQSEIAISQNTLLKIQKQLNQVKQIEIPSLQNQLSQQQQQNTKSQKFLEYLLNYKQQLHQTSILMLQQLNTSCHQDFNIITRNKTISPFNQRIQTQNMSMNQSTTYFKLHKLSQL